MNEPAPPSSVPAAPAIVILGQGSLETARRIQDACPGALIHGLARRVAGADIAYDEFGATLREIYCRDVPLIVLCATGIIIRSLAPLLQDKRAEPPVLAVAEDGSAVVPLLGGLRGVNTLARQVGAALATRPAITTTGEVRFHLALENPPPGYVLRNPADGKKFMSDLLAGAAVRVQGEAPWLAETRIPRDIHGPLTLTVTPEARDPGPDELIFHPRSVVIAVAAETADLPGRIEDGLARAGLAKAAVAFVLATESDGGRADVKAAAARLACPLRLVPDRETRPSPADLIHLAVPDPIDKIEVGNAITVARADTPEAIVAAGHARGRLAVVGLGPGHPGLMAPQVKEELRRATDIVGYETYVRMAGPFRPDQTVHASDNRVEMDRARHAFELAAQGRHVVVVSSGDPGIFAMATAVVDALHHGRDHRWDSVELAILPGISAAQAAAAKAGAPLGHDFCVLSLSDNLKPWDTVVERLTHAAAADLVLAFYNPISKARPWQLGKALDTVRRHRAGTTPVILGRDIGRPDEHMSVTTLDEVRPEQVDMRTVVIIGSSLTRAFQRMDGSTWVYTPRWYGTDPASPLTP